MISSFSCEGALAAVRERWNLIHSRAKKNAGETKVGDTPPQLQVSISGFYTSNARCQPSDVWNNSFYEAILRDETFEDVELGGPHRATHSHMQPQKVVERPMETVMYENCSSLAPLETHPDPIETPDSTPSRSLALDEPPPSAVQRAPFVEDTLTAEPEAISPSKPSPDVQYTPGGRAIPAVPYSKCKSPTRLSLSYPVRPAKSLDESGRSQRDSYTRITPLAPSQALNRRRSRYVRSKASSMASTPISEDDEISFESKGSSSSNSTMAQSDEVLRSSPRTESSSTDDSVGAKCDRSKSNDPVSVASDTSSAPSHAQGPRRAEYVEDTQLLSVRRQQLKHQKWHGQPGPKDLGYRQMHQTRGFTYPPVGTHELQVSNSHSDMLAHPYRSTRHASLGEYPSVAGTGAGARRVPSNYSLHQRTMLSQWRANLAAESSKQSTESPWTAQGGDAIAAGELHGAHGAHGPAVPSTVTREPWRERQTQNGSAGWGSRGEARMLSGMDAREIELAHREVLRRMQAGANRRLELSQIC